MLGQRVNNFEIVSLLGQGGMGAVYEAKHPLIAKRVAIKVLKPELSVDAGQVQRFFNEARATSAIRHPNIVEVIDLGRLPAGTPYLVMELLEGESLADRLDRSGPLQVPLALDFARQAASALEAAHAHGIVHRDLKPDNLFLVPDQRIVDRELVKVLDFGVAKLRGELASGSVNTIAGVLLGTPPYMSPEQCRGLHDAVDERTDIYALGIILYEMLCGRTPFEAEGIGDVILMHLSEAPQPPSQLCRDLPHHIEAAVLRALAKRREDRFGSMAELRAALGPSAVRIVAISDPPSAPAAARTQSSNDDDVVTLRGTTSPVTSAAPVERPAGPSRPGTAAGGRAIWITAAAALLAFSLALLVLTRLGVQPELVEPASHVGAAAARPPSPTAAPRPAAAIAPPVAAASSPAAPPEVAAEQTPASRPHARTARIVDDTRRTRRTQAAASAQPAVWTAQSPQPSDPATPASVRAEGTPTSAPAEAPGFLSLDSSPWANVFLGSKLLGTTPLMHVALPPGRHVLTLKNPELDAATSYVVEIKSGASQSRMVGWEGK